MCHTVVSRLSARCPHSWPETWYPVVVGMTEEVRELGIGDRPVEGRWTNSRAESSHQRFRSRKRAMSRFRRMRNLRRFASVQATVSNHLNQERCCSSRLFLKLSRTAALAERRQGDAA